MRPAPFWGMFVQLLQQQQKTRMRARMMIQVLQSSKMWQRQLLLFIKPFSS